MTKVEEGRAKQAESEAEREEQGAAELARDEKRAEVREERSGTMATLEEAREGQAAAELARSAQRVADHERVAEDRQVAEEARLADAYDDRAKEEAKKRLDICRVIHRPDCTIGIIRLGELEYWCVERPWLDNQLNISCIPAGYYDIRIGTFHIGGYQCLEFLDVPNRSAIKVHIANRASELEGCVAVGESLGWMYGEWAVFNSRRAFQKLMHTAKALKVSQAMVYNGELP